MNPEMKIADGETPDRFGVIWPKGYEVCGECGQPDNCGDCNHQPLGKSEVRQIIFGLLGGSL